MEKFNGCVFYGRRPFSSAKAFSEVSGRAPRCWMTSAAASAPSLAAARLGALAAAEVIQHLGARPETSLKALAEENGLLR